MNIVDWPNLSLSEFSIGPYRATRNTIIYLFSNRVEHLFTAPPSWSGTATLTTGDINHTRHVEKRKLLTRFHHLLQNSGVSNIPLPNDFLPVKTPEEENFSAKVSSAEIVDKVGLEIGLTFSNKGDFVNTVGDYINISDRLYMITYVSGNDLRVVPEVVPMVGATVEIARPFVRALLDGSSPIARVGARPIQHSFPWFEYIP